MTEADTGVVDPDGPDPKRRRLLTLGVSGVGAAGVVALAVPMLSSFAPSRRAKAAGAPVKADIGKLEPGQMVVAQTDEGEATLKYWFPERRRIRLQPANSAMKPIYVRQAHVIGVVVGVVRNFQ